MPVKQPKYRRADAIKTFVAFLAWTVVVVSEVGLVVMMFIDPIWGLGAIVFTLAVWLAVMAGWLPLPQDRQPRSRH